ncbi:hypothetical protein PYWP30_00647 [Pyrobaculum sp. WP30]|nr:hypothetical protein PYWP30_00647 [Pyrobaculum sp. WP30]
MSNSQLAPNDDAELLGVDRVRTCHEEGAEVFKANSATVVVSFIFNSLLFSCSINLPPLFGYRLNARTR